MMELLKKLLKYVNVKGLLMELVLKELVEPALKKLVANTDNKIDDAFVGVALPLIEQELEKLVDEKLAEWTK